MTTTVTDSKAPAWLPLAAVSCTLLFWASAFVAIRHLGNDFSPGALSAGPRWWRRCAWLPWPCRASTSTNKFALNAGERTVDAGTAAMLIQVSPVLIAVSPRSSSASSSRPLGVGLALAFTAAALIVHLPRLQRPGRRGVLVSCITYSVSLILQKPLVGHLPAVHVTWLACSVGAISCLPFAGQLVPARPPTPRRSTSVVYCAYLVFPRRWRSRPTPMRYDT